MATTNKLSMKLAALMERYAPGEGVHATPVPGVYCTKYSTVDRRTKRRWHARVGIVAQGCKEIVLDGKIYSAGAGHTTVTPVDLPVISRVAAASPEKPFLALLIDFDPRLVSEVAAQLSSDVVLPQENPPVAIFTGEANEPLMKAALRLVKLFEKPADARVLGSLVVKEIIYHVLQGENGAAIRQFVRAGSKMHQISQAIHRLKSELAVPLSTVALLSTANMSRTAFFKHFKQVTTMSPIQYQKRLRLLEARRLMLEEKQSAEGSAFKVGYNSASQFSREYSRMFGQAPLRDVLAMKKQGL